MMAFAIQVIAQRSVHESRSNRICPKGHPKDLRMGSRSLSFHESCEALTNVISWGSRANGGSDTVVQHKFRTRNHVSGNLVVGAFVDPWPKVSTVFMRALLPVPRSTTREPAAVFSPELGCAQITTP